MFGLVYIEIVIEEKIFMTNKKDLKKKDSPLIFGHFSSSLLVPY